MPPFGIYEAVAVGLFPQFVRFSNGRTIVIVPTQCDSIPHVGVKYFPPFCGRRSDAKGEPYTEEDDLWGWFDF